tara:strand:- start:4087 stop:5463 length:1377 start_codon:yes stop_codon:yes gene_type:complete
MKTGVASVLSALIVCQGTSLAAPIGVFDESRVRDVMSAYEVDGLAVAVVIGQETRLVGAWGVDQKGEDFSASSGCGIYSATKFLSSLTYADLVAAGQLDIDRPLSAFLVHAPPAWSDIPFWRLLNHTSGIPMVTNQTVFGELESDPAAGNSEIYDYVRDLPLDYEPGAYSRYRQSGYAVAEMIASKETGLTWTELVDERVLAPAGLEATFHAATSEGARNAELLTSAGGYETTAEDMETLFKALNADVAIDRENWAGLLFNEQYIHDGYGLGTVLVDVAGERTLGHSGGGRANIRYAPDAEVGVFVCTDDRSNNNVHNDLANMLMLETLTGEKAPLPFQFFIAAHKDGPIETLIADYLAEQAETDAPYDLSDVEGRLNALGYSLLSEERYDDAIAIFKLNVEEHPVSANTYDSLAEAYMLSGDKEQAISNYQKSLDLNPGSANAKAMLEKLKRPSSDR